MDGDVYGETRTVRKRSGVGYGRHGDYVPNVLCERFRGKAIFEIFKTPGMIMVEGIGRPLLQIVRFRFSPKILPLLPPFSSHSFEMARNYNPTRWTYQFLPGCRPCRQWDEIVDSTCSTAGSHEARNRLLSISLFLSPFFFFL